MAQPYATLVGTNFALFFRNILVLGAFPRVPSGTATTTKETNMVREPLALQAAKMNSTFGAQTRHPPTWKRDFLGTGTIQTQWMGNGDLEVTGKHRVSTGFNFAVVEVASWIFLQGNSKTALDWAEQK